MTRALVALVLLAACGDPTPTCDRLTGIWEDGDGRRYHVIDQAGAIEVFALADSRGNLDRPMPGARRSASYARLERNGERLGPHPDPPPKGEGDRGGFAFLKGRGQQFRARGDRVCRVRWQIVGVCRDGELELRISEPGDVDFEDCRQSPDHAERSVALERIDAP